MTLAVIVAFWFIGLAVDTLVAAGRLPPDF